jgi:nitroreductase
MNTLDAIKSKRAIRKFEDKPLSQETIKIILNAGRLAQSAKNVQPWQFIAIQEKEILKSLSKLGHFAGHLAGAAMGVAILTPPTEKRFSILFDAGQSAAYMQLAAWEMGVGSCLATIYEPEKARDLLDFPDDWHIHIAISFGYPIPEENAPRPPRKTGRKRIDEVVHWDKWSADK